MRTEAIQHFRNAGDHERAARFAGEVVSEGREILDVVEVEMRKKDVADLRLLPQGQPRPDSAGIHKDRVIDQQSTGPALHGPAVTIEKLIGAMTAQHADFHTKSLCPNTTRQVRTLATDNSCPFKKQILEFFPGRTLAQSPGLAS